MTPRIASLLPSATEIACALGAESDLVGVSHACDFPPGVRRLPILTRSRVDAAGPDAGIDAQVHELALAGDDLYAVDVEALRKAAPDVVLAQDLCQVCAVGPRAAKAAVEAAGLAARVVVLGADSLAGVARDAIAVGAALGRPDRGEDLAHELARRLAELWARTAGLEPRRVVALEWIDPPFAAGHWVPQMVSLAGGRELLGWEGRESRRVSWEEIREAGPEALCLVPCGFDLERTRRSWREARRALASAGSALAEVPAFALDAGALVSRPGPRLVRGAEALAALLHPEAGLPPPAPYEGGPA